MSFTESELIEIANIALSQYLLDVNEVYLINNEYNATFKVVTKDGQRFALRININSPRSIANLKAEIAWVNFLVADSRVNVPHPIPSVDGQYFITFNYRSNESEFKCVLYSWLDGEELGDDPTFEQLRLLGAAMAALHLSSRDFQLPADAQLPIFKDPLWETEDHLLSTKSVLEPDAKALVAQAITAARIVAFADLGMEAIWKIDKKILNSAGNLSLHLVGNINHFIGSILGHSGYVRNRELEFSLKNIPKTELILQIEKTIEVVHSSLDQLSEEDLNK